MVYCSICGAEFKRTEHLERHNFKHNNIRPFKCDLCQMSYSRRDVLQRHVTNVHTKDDDGIVPQIGSVHTTRTPQACYNCAKAKVKCESSFPCRRCRSRGLSCLRNASNWNRSSPQDASEDVTFSGSSISAIDLGNETNPTRAIAGDTPIDTNENFHLSQTLEQRDSSVEHVPMLFGVSLDSDHSASSIQTHIPGAAIDEGQASDAFPSGTSFDTGFHDIDSLNIPLFDHLSNNGAWDKTLTPLLMGNIDSLSHETAPPQEQSKTGEYEHPSIIEARRFWTLFNCTPRLSEDRWPRTTAIFLMDLTRQPEPFLDDSHCHRWQSNIGVSLEMSYSGLEILAQEWFQRAVNVHRRDIVHLSGTAVISALKLKLPHVKFLEHLLEESNTVLDHVGDLIRTGHPTHVGPVFPTDRKVSGLHVLLKLSLGAVTCPSIEGSRLADGLIEICRSPLYETMDTNNERISDPAFIECVLLYMLAGMWSGDKIVMDFALGLRHVYIEAFRHYELFSIDKPKLDTDTSDASACEQEWLSWRRREAQIRLAIALIFVDQEVSLLGDTQAITAAFDLDLALPSHDSLWRASTSRAWKTLLLQQQLAITQGEVLMPDFSSLKAAFRQFQRSDGSLNRSKPSLTVLRAILYFIQAMIQSGRRLYNSLAIEECTGLNGNLELGAITVHTQHMLDMWYKLFRSRTSEEREWNSSSVLICKMIYHLTYMTTACSFIEIEKIARTKFPDSVLRSNTRLVKRCVQNDRIAIWHAGQVLNLVDHSETSSQPLWWAAALYRATLAIWACGLFTEISKPSERAVHFHINTAQDMPLVQMFIQGDKSGIIPALYVFDDQSTAITDLKATLDFCLKKFGFISQTRFARGVHSHLSEFVERRAAFAEI